MRQQVDDLKVSLRDTAIQLPKGEIRLYVELDIRPITGHAPGLRKKSQSPQDGGVRAPGSRVPCP